MTSLSHQALSYPIQLLPVGYGKAIDRQQISRGPLSSRPVSSEQNIGNGEGGEETTGKQEHRVSLKEESNMRPLRSDVDVFEIPAVGATIHEPCDSVSSEDDPCDSTDYPEYLSA